MATPDPFPTSVSSLVLPIASQNFSSTLSALKRSTLSTRNRLQSIHDDSIFVREVADRYNLPLVGNERCGSWYISPEKKAGSAYFKSTDGHWGQWGFSTRRLNLHLFEIIGRCGGCILVDSTRRGKSMPDALSKTIPIWCAVINRLLFQDLEDSHKLYIPEGVVGFSEQAQIEARLPVFVVDAKYLGLDISSLRSVLKKPLRPFWISPSFTTTELPPSNGHHRIICCTASHHVKGAELTGNGYIQGAGDDSEGWAHGLTPYLFWKHKSQLLGVKEENMADSIYEIIHAEILVAASHGSDAFKIGSTGLHVGTLPEAQKVQHYDGIVICSAAPPKWLESEDQALGKRQFLHFKCSDGKLGSRSLRTHLPRLQPFMASLATHVQSPKLLFACPTGKDLSVGVALTVLVMFFDDQYQYSCVPRDTAYGKTLIRRRLAYISEAKPDVNPSRSTLQSINTYLMPRDG